MCHKFPHSAPNTNISQKSLKVTKRRRKREENTKLLSSFSFQRKCFFFIQPFEMIGFHFSWVGGCCVHFIERWAGQICHELKKYLFRFLVVLEVLQGASGVEDLPDCKAAQSLSRTATLWKWRKCEHFPRRRNNIQSNLEEERDLWCWMLILPLILILILLLVQRSSTLSHCSHPGTSAALLFSQICMKYIWNWQILYLWPHPGTATALLYGSERIFGGEILVIFSQIWNWPNIIVINYSHKWRHPGIFIFCSIVTQMNCFVQLMCYLFCQKIGMEKKSCKFSKVLQVCGRIWGPSRIEINVSTAGKWPQFSENAILWSLNARTHTHCVWKF